jgi:hypothetical protein
MDDKKVKTWWCENLNYRCIDHPTEGLPRKMRGDKQHGDEP